jgi:hypothetical protein
MNNSKKHSDIIHRKIQGQNTSSQPIRHSRLANPSMATSVRDV